MEALRSVVLSAAVMTHPRRVSDAEAIRAAHPELDLKIVIDPDPHGPRSALRTARLAWAAVSPEATHHVVVQDDMTLVNGFASQVRAAAATLPDRVLCLFTEWGSRTANALRLATLEGASWVPVIDPYVPTTAAVLPADLARELAGYLAEADCADDVLVLSFLREHGHTALVGVPNLAEHNSPESLVGNDIVMGRRRSALYAGDLADIPPPTGRVSTSEVVPHLLMFEGASTCHVRRDGAWVNVRTHDYLGVPLEDLLGMFTSQVGPTRVGEILGESLLFQFWLTVLAYGAVSRDLSRLEDPLVSAALHTLPAGTLRRFVPDRLLPRLPELLLPLIHETLHAGHKLSADAA